VALKFLLALASLPVFLLTPWPLKIIIDNVINGRPLKGIAHRLLFPLVGDDRFRLLAVVVGLLFLGALLVGTVGDNPEDLDADVASGGLDQAGLTANQANNGWSLFSGLLGLLEVWVTLDLTQRLNQTVRTALYERLLRSPLRVFTDQKIGDAVFRVMHDSAAIGEVLYSGVLAPTMSIIMIILTTAVLGAQFGSEPLIPILAGLALPTADLASALFSRRLRDQSQRMRERGSAVMAVFEERIAQVQLIKAFGQEAREIAAVDAESRGSFRATLTMLVLLMTMLLLVIPVLGLVAGVGLYHLMSEVIANRITLGDVALLAGYGIIIGRSMLALGQVWTSLQGPIAGMRRVHSVLDSLPRETAPSDGGHLAEPIREIELSNVSIGYTPDAPVLEQVRLRFVTGELAGIAGPSGTGKSTLVNCIPRFLEPSAGEILINRANARAFSLAALRRRIALVFQEEALFSTTIADNIGYGVPDAPAGALRKAAELAGAAEFIERMPQGYRTMLGRRGTRLSAGQKQRVAIARALLRDPDVLILDEPMGPLDPASESSLLEVLRQLAHTRIVIVVGHRAETLAACDRVHFISDRSVRASGTHAELIKTCAGYVAYLAMSASELRR
jgi:ABC-type multidrug transport system fused ATPase/permease subunit